jgi:hypothetical protein
LPHPGPRDAGTAAPTNPANDYGAYKAAPTTTAIIDNVVDTLRGRNAPTTNALEGLKVVEIIERIYGKGMNSDMYERLVRKEAKLAVIGLGYVGLPIALAFARKLKVVGFDINQKRVDMMRRGEDPSNELGKEDFAGCDIHFTASTGRPAGRGVLHRGRAHAHR